MALTPLDSEATFDGVGRSVSVLSPSWPSLFRPQHFTPPPLVSAQLWKAPALTVAMPLPRPVTATGSPWSKVDPLPSCPDAFRPQQYAAPAMTAQV